CGFKAPYVGLYVEAVARAANDDEPRDRITAAKDAASNYQQNKPTRGFPELKKAFGQEIAGKVAEWLGYRTKDPDPPSDDEEILAELNRDNAVVLDAARTRVLRFEEVMHEASGERYSYRLPTFLRFQDFRDFYLNRYINVGDDKKSKKVPIGKWWLEHP